MLEEQFPYNRKICAVNVSLLFSSDFVTNSYGESWDSCSQKSRVSVHNHWVSVQKNRVLNWKCLSLYVTRQLIWRQTPELYLLQLTEIKI